MIKLCGFYTANNILSECCRFRGSRFRVQGLRFPGEMRCAVAIANFTPVPSAGATGQAGHSGAGKYTQMNTKLFIV